jgi:hypothetical protein
MPFRAMTDPAELEAAARALDAAWETVRRLGAVMPGSEAAEKQRLAYLVAMLVPRMEASVVAEEAVKRFLAARTQDE